MNAKSTPLKEDELDKVDRILDKLVAQTISDYQESVTLRQLMPRIRDAKTELEKYIHQQVVEARIDELSEIKKLQDYSTQYHDYNHVMWEVEGWINKRLAELTRGKGNDE